MIRDKILNRIKKSIKDIQKEGNLAKVEILKIGRIEIPENKIHGDYSTNVAMVMAKILKKDPMEIANLLGSRFKVKGLRYFDKVEVVKPGFINFFLSKEFFIKELKRIIKEKDKYGKSKFGKGKTVVIDYSSPNIAKPFGIGHLRSTIIGQALYNIYKFLGWECIGDNHLGDWGTQFGKLIVAIKKWSGERIKDLSINDLEELYVKFHEAAEKDPKLDEEARIWFKKLEERAQEARRIWKICVDISLKEFDRIYKLLGIKIDYALGESFYEGMLKEIVKEAKEKKVAIESQRALIIQYPKNELPPAMILKSDGGTTYLTRDLATVKYRLKRWKPDLIIYEVGADQELHLKQLFRAVELLGWPAFAIAMAGKPKKTRFFHVAHGLYRTKTGKFSTRRGETVHLEEVLKEAIERAKEIIETPHQNKFGTGQESETGRGLSVKEKKEIAQKIGIGAVKYNDLSQHYSKDIIFDWEKILNLKGNSGPYLQYTFARCQSVLRKAKSKTELPFMEAKVKKRMESSSPLKKIKVLNFNEEEEDILREIYKFPEIVQESAEKFSPNLICNFAFNLSQKYNLFYDLHPILKAKTEELKIFRLALTMAVSQILKNSLNLLGISVPEKM